jgi:NAD(P)-dependent dehydrogenase (short-subunit alcohol dehydrogenase family)
MSSSRSRDALDGKVVVVTGAARGIGALLARRLAARGARLALVGLEPDELKAVAESINRPAERTAGRRTDRRTGRYAGPDAAYWVADVTDRAAMERAAAEVAEHFGRVDVVVANAGVATGGPFMDSDPDTFDRVIQVNLLGSVTTARAFLPALLASRGYLLQVASLAAMAPSPWMTAYCASKSGVEAFAHCLRGELGHKGVDVGVAYLSWTDTDMVRGADQDGLMREMRARLPWPANRTYPAEPAVERIAAGIERRSAHVYGQGWLRGMQSVRSWLPTLIGGPLGRKEIRRMEPKLREAGGALRRGLVGRGGEADEAARAAAGRGGAGGGQPG